MMAEQTVPMENQHTNAVQESTREAARYVTPPVDIYEESDKLVVVSDMPGTEKDSIKINVEKNILTLEGSQPENGKHDNLYREFERVNYFRQFELSEAVDIEKISAELKNGVLHLTLPKAAKAQPRKIEVKVHE